MLSLTLISIKDDLSNIGDIIDVIHLKPEFAIPIVLFTQPNSTKALLKKV